jgi:hypothetical protein
MQERRFNFVKRKSAIKFDFVTRNARVTAGNAMPKGVVRAVRGFLLTTAVFVVFIFSANLIVRYAFEKIDIKGFTLDISPFAKPKYFISKGNMFVVYSNGRIEMAKSNMDSVSLPFISGVDTDEKRITHKKALAMALDVNKKYLSSISEINLANPENIIMITVAGKRIYAGDVLNDEKMDNYHMALEKITRNYSIVDLRYKDRVIIK